MSDGEIQNPVNVALNNIDEVIRALDRAMAEARRCEDSELVQRIAAAKMKSERSAALIGELRNMLAGEKDSEQSAGLAKSRL